MNFLLTIFCKAYLAKNKQNDRILDLDVGKLLGLDSADCSHWKSGRKKIGHISQIKSISLQLQVDVQVISELALGEVTPEQAFDDLESLHSSVIVTVDIRPFFYCYRRSYEGEEEGENFGVSAFQGN